MNKSIGFVAAAAIIAASAGASSAPRVKAAIAPAPRCGSYLPLKPALCAQLLRAGAAMPHRTWMSASAGTALLYASQPFTTTVSVFGVTKRGMSPVGVIGLGSGTFPLGMTVDASRNLYVAAASFGSGTPGVYVFPRGATQPSEIYTAGLVGPFDVAVDASGTLYVGNNTGPYCTDSSRGGDVVEYANGSKTPTAVITDIPGCPNGVAVDPSDNLYVSYYVYPNSGVLKSDVMKYAPGSTHGDSLNLSVPGGALLWHPAIDAHGDVAVANIQADSTLEQILVFGHGSKTPTQTIQDGPGWSSIFFAIQGNRLFTGCFEQVPLGNEPAEFAYPSGRERFVMSPKKAPVGGYYGFAFSP